MFIANFANADYCTFSNDEILDSCFLDKCQKTTSSLGLSKVQIILEKYRSRSFTKWTPFSCKIIQILGCSSSDDSVNSDCTGGTFKVVVGSCWTDSGGISSCIGSVASGGNGGNGSGSGSVYRTLHNELSYARILIGSHLWSIRGQTYRWRHHQNFFNSLSYKTNRFQVDVRLFSNRSQMTSKRG